MKNKYLVTGGLGFIGSHLVKKLLADDDNIVFVVDDLSNNSITDPNTLHPKCRNLMAQLADIYSYENDSAEPRLVVIEGDCVHKSIINRVVAGEFTTIFHLAAKPRVEWCVENPTLSTSENFNKSIALAYAAAQGKTKFVFSSTSAVYGDGVGLPTCETEPTNPNSPYGLAKLCVEQYLDLYEKLYNLDWVALRYFNAYGPGQLGDSPYSTAIAAWCHKAKKDEPLRSDGDGEQSRDMVFVEDIAQANIIMSVFHTADTGNRIYNIGTGMSYTNNQILSLFADKGFDSVTRAPERPGDVKHTRANINRLREDFLWSPPTSLEDGLALTFNWWGL